MSVSGEYRNGEFFFDWDEQNAEAISSAMGASSFAIGFGDKNDMIRNAFSERFDRLLQGAFRAAGAEAQLGRVTYYTPREMLEACRGISAPADSAP
ncbi:MAG: hypothetical protein J0H01_35405 [Rhizobiales bacterium]|nr:hypothetical protein [Hyphomicrobiales bacterium]